MPFEFLENTGGRAWECMACRSSFLRSVERRSKVCTAVDPKVRVKLFHSRHKLGRMPMYCLAVMTTPPLSH